MTDERRFGGGDESRVQALMAENARLKADQFPRGTTYDLWYLEQEDGSWIVKCQEHKAWKYTADTFDEAKAGAPTSLKKHHSRHLAFRHYVVGKVTI